MGKSQLTEFGQAFQLHEGIEVLVSSAVQSGTPIWPDYAVAALTAAFPEGTKDTVGLRQAVIQAALQAGVPVRTISAAVPPAASAAPAK